MAADSQLPAVSEKTVLQAMRVTARIADHVETTTTYNLELKSAVAAFVQKAQQVADQVTKIVQSFGGAKLTDVADAAKLLSAKIAEHSGGMETGSWLEGLSAADKKKWAKIKVHAETTIRISKVATELDKECELLEQAP